MPRRLRGNSLCSRGRWGMSADASDNWTWPQTGIATRLAFGWNLWPIAQGDE
ncbi:hypothetical protein AS9A_1742 [Hoyosella subflava DQS3-9A1]|uniref:Uncharacterized protein n=1 Tax=Hoyosella subflava (strain DSM 45089 / JCM 17490 / NBRC 109087 / DQS3-9A1) TaxID=443218 RepID=F6EKQ5_HOYSD|nr:hypothetical protein AS9A_1742 [Hoyosella subflava DQS3-9A1]